MRGEVKLLSTIIQTTVIYWATALDLLILIALLYIRYDDKRHREITKGQIIGSLSLVIVSFLLAIVFKIALPEWILGFLGLVPLVIGAKILIFGDDDSDAEEALEKRKDKNLMITAMLLAFSSCGADNIGLFTPYFVAMQSKYLALALLVFFANILLFSFLSDKLAHLTESLEWLEKYSRWLIGVIFVGLGIYVLFDAGTLSMLMKIIFG